jgi:hypothetical protein
MKPSDNKNEISRRDFLKGAALAMGVLGLTAGLAGCGNTDAVSANPSEEDGGSGANSTDAGTNTGDTTGNKGTGGPDGTGKDVTPEVKDEANMTTEELIAAAGMFDSVSCFTPTDCYGEILTKDKTGYYRLNIYKSKGDYEWQIRQLMMDGAQKTVADPSSDLVSMLNSIKWDKVDNSQIITYKQG